MITNDKNIMGVVIECYDHNATHRILVVQSDDAPKILHFFYIPKTPQVDFGDIIQMNFADSKSYIYRGNSRLSYRISPSIFPGTLLWELITERLSQ